MNDSGSQPAAQTREPSRDWMTHASGRALVPLGVSAEHPAPTRRYGETIGLHIVRLPPASSSPYTRFRANLGERGVTMISIGRSSLALEGSTNATDPAYARALGATSRFITIDQEGVSTGIRR